VTYNYGSCWASYGENPTLAPSPSRWPMSSNGGTRSGTLVPNNKAPSSVRRRQQLRLVHVAQLRRRVEMRHRLQEDQAILDNADQPFLRQRGPSPPTRSGTALWTGVIDRQVNANKTNTIPNVSLSKVASVKSTQCGSSFPTTDTVYESSTRTARS